MKHQTTLLVVAGEASADVNTAAILAELLSIEAPPITVFGVGGERMAKTGFEIIEPASTFSVVGLTEVVRLLPGILAATQRILKEVRKRKPKAALLVDLPDFNVRLGPILARMGIPVFYMGAPQAWAWREGRAAAMAKWVEYLACFFPFEASFFGERGVNAHFVGHPRTPAAHALRPRVPGRCIAIMPGSRHSELNHHMPALRKVIPELVRRYPNNPLVMPIAPGLQARDLRAHLGGLAHHIDLRKGDALHVLKEARLALVASGTAVTEALLMHVPMVVFYRLSNATFAMAKQLVRVPHIAMTNILAGKQLVPELVQHDFRAEHLLHHTHRLLSSESVYQSVRQDIIQTARMLEHDEGDAATLVAQHIARALASTKARKLESTEARKLESSKD